MLKLEDYKEFPLLYELMLYNFKKERGLKEIPNDLLELLHVSPLSALFIFDKTDQEKLWRNLFAIQDFKEIAKYLNTIGNAYRFLKLRENNLFMTSSLGRNIIIKDYEKFLK